MRIADRHIAALQALGYTETEARFVYVVATHSGYFTLHQFLTFSGVQWGKRCTKFGLKLEGHGHACWREYAGVGRVHHLFSKPLYAEIGKQNLRNRRRHAREFVLARPVLLAFILENQQHDYLETEQAKVAYFCEQLGLPRQTLPVKAYHGSSRTEPTLRYFIDKYPLFFAASDTSPSPVVTFSYVDPGYAGTLALPTTLASTLLCYGRCLVSAFFTSPIRHPISSEQSSAFPCSSRLPFRLTFRPRFCAISSCAKHGT